MADDEQRRVNVIVISDSDLFKAGEVVELRLNRGRTHRVKDIVSKLRELKPQIEEVYIMTDKGFLLEKFNSIEVYDTLKAIII